MARMFPDAAPVFGDGLRAEQALFTALARDLPDEYVVVHSLRYVTGERAGEGEIDFLIVHRERGLLVLECKGYGVRANRQGQWFRQTDAGPKELDEAPLAQAQRHIHDLARELAPRVAETWPDLRGRFPFSFGHAVAFPLTSVEAVNLPLDCPRRLVLDVSDLPHVRERVEGLMDYWSGAADPHRPVLDAQRFRRFVHHLLLPKLDLAVCLGSRLAVGRQAFVRLGDEQKRVVAGLMRNRRLRVVGGAGSGKTMLALEAARLHACQGRDVLFLCFNKALARHVEALVPALELPAGRIDAVNFHRLCYRASGLLGKAFEPPTGDRAAETAFWNDEAPLLLLEALEAHVLPRYDALVLDEGQDFLADWWTVLGELLRHPTESHRAVFYDPGQEIFERGCHVPDEGMLYELSWNLRNTRAIGRFVARLGQVPVEPHPDLPEGEAPEILGQPERAPVALEALSTQVRRLLANERVPVESIALLSPHSRPHSLLAGRTELAGIPLAHDPQDRAGRLLHVTIGAFKGLEADVVILFDVDPDDPRSNRNAVYVAASRAVQRLLVFEKKTWLGSLV